MKTKIIKNIPNVITLSRLISVILGFILFVKGEIVVSVILFIYGAISDFLDGYLARKFDAYSKFGAYMDALIDKMYTLFLVILSVINGNYLMLVVGVFDIFIAIINFKTMKLKKSAHTERVGKFKMTFEFMLLVVSILLIFKDNFKYLFIILFVLTVYFEIQSINAYINQKNNKDLKGIITNDDYVGKSYKDKLFLILKEFVYYLFNPVKIIK